MDNQERILALLEAQELRRRSKVIVTATENYYGTSFNYITVGDLEDGIVKLKETLAPLNDELCNLEFLLEKESRNE